MLHVGLLVVCHCPVFVGSHMPIGLLSANCGSAQSVMMPGVLVVGGGAWRGGWARGDGALAVIGPVLVFVLPVTPGLLKRLSRLFCVLPFFYLAWAMANQ